MLNLSIKEQNFCIKAVVVQTSLLVNLCHFLLKGDKYLTGLYHVVERECVYYPYFKENSSAAVLGCGQ